jgi:hypothetical protein
MKENNLGSFEPRARRTQMCHCIPTLIMLHISCPTVYDMTILHGVLPSSDDPIKHVAHVPRSSLGYHRDKEQRVHQAITPPPLSNFWCTETPLTKPRISLHHNAVLLASKIED